MAIKNERKIIISIGGVSGMKLIFLAWGIINITIILLQQWLLIRMQTIIVT
jgi:hypothetical protein